jgi:type II secretory pathway predicted ATPase ExeA
MYLKHWGLQQYPFENVPDPAFMYYSPAYEEALARLVYAVKRNKGISLLTGEVGCGKTTLSRVLIRQLAETEFDIGLLTNPALTPIDFLKEALNQLDLVSPSESKADLLKLLNNRMIENARNGRSTLLIVDESQLLSRDTLEEIRLLLNFQLNDRHLLNLVLIGQPELMDMIKGYKQLDQRIAVRYHLNPLSIEEAKNYITFRLTKAGRADNPFTAAAMEEIYNVAEGIPRVINKISDLALLVGSGQGAAVIDIAIIKRITIDDF